MQRTAEGQTTTTISPVGVPTVPAPGSAGRVGHAPGGADRVRSGPGGLSEGSPERNRRSAPELFAVWAPAAERVDLHVMNHPVAMEAGRDGWWRPSVALGEALAGLSSARYGFSLDEGPVRPDPRSQSQPEGVHGLSEVVDHESFLWTDNSWRGVSLPGAVLYELHVGTFTPEGTFEGVIERLPHLVELGVDAIELMPVAEFDGRWGWGYDGVSLYAPHHAYGGPTGLKRLVDACHAAGLGVVIDVVYNHLGPSGNHLAEFGPYFTDRHVTNWGPAVNFDGAGSHQVRRFVVDNAVMWLRDYHADGLRLDAVHAVLDQSARHILEELSEEVDALAAHVCRPLFVIAESDLNDPRFVSPPQLGGYGMDACWADEWHHALHSVLTGERSGYYSDFGSLALLGKVIRQAWAYDGQFSEHRQRRHGRPPVGLTGDRFVVFTQNHDQVGNRAVGERLGALTSEGRLRVAAALLLTSPFTPMLFQGEEWGAGTPFLYFTDFADSDLGEAVSEGRRNEFSSFGWEPSEVPDPQQPSSFKRSRLDWAEPTRLPHSDLLAWYRELIALRRSVPALSDHRADSISVEIDEEAQSITVARQDVLVVANLGRSPIRRAARGAELLAASTDGVRLRNDDLAVPADAVAIVRLAADRFGEHERREVEPELAPPEDVDAEPGSADA